jgi:rare lipoprotein A
MKFTLSAILLSIACSSCASTSGYRFDRRGIASWYGSEHQGKKTASGERFDMNQLTAAHRTLPFGTWVKVRSLKSDKEVRVRINDRGPYARGRIIDLSRKAAEQLDMIKTGEQEVEISVE